MIKIYKPNYKSFGNIVINIFLIVVYIFLLLLDFTFIIQGREIFFVSVFSVCLISLSLLIFYTYSIKRHAYLYPDRLEITTTFWMFRNRSIRIPITFNNLESIRFHKVLMITKVNPLLQSQYGPALHPWSFVFDCSYKLRQLRRVLLLYWDKPTLQQILHDIKQLHPINILDESHKTYSEIKEWYNEVPLITTIRE